MKVSNEVYKKVTIDWANVTLPLKEGSPVSSAGVVANSGSAFGIVPQAYNEEPLEKTIYVLVGGHVDLNEIETLYGSSYDDAAISALNGIHFYKNGKSIDYTLPKASADTLGGIKVGSGLSIDSSGVLSASGGGGSFVITATTEDDVITLDKTWQEIYDALADGKYCVIVESEENYATQTFVPTALDGGGSYMIFASEDIYTASSASGYPSLGGGES